MEGSEVSSTKKWMKTESIEEVRDVNSPVNAITTYQIEKNKEVMKILHATHSFSTHTEGFIEKTSILIVNRAYR